MAAGLTTTVRWVMRILAILVLGMVTFAIVVLIVIPRATHGTALTVLTGSMSPGIPVGAVVIDRPVDPGTLHVGDIATYQKTPGQADYITHRIVKIDTSKNPVEFTFKGDANRGPDINPVPVTAIRGKVWFHVPHLGGIRDAIQTKGGLAGVAVVLLAGYALFQVAGANKDRRDAKAGDASSDTNAPVADGQAVTLATARQRLKLLNTLPTDELDQLSPQAVLRLVGGAFVDDEVAFAARVVEATSAPAGAPDLAEDASVDGAAIEASSGEATRRTAARAGARSRRRRRRSRGRRAIGTVNARTAPWPSRFWRGARRV